MMDPMANLGGGAIVEDPTEEKDIIDFNSLRYNLDTIDRTRSVMGIVYRG